MTTPIEWSSDDKLAELYRADARQLDMLDDNTIDLIVTSPPYWALRSYQDDGEHYAGQIGSEATPAEFVDTLIDCTREWCRVLKPSGSMFINLGDNYAGSGGGNDNTGLGLERGEQDDAADRRGNPRRYLQTSGVARPKTLLGIPWRYANRCVDDLDLILRAEIVWCLSGGTRIYARINGKPRPIMIRDLYRSYQPETVELWNGTKWTQVKGWSRTARTGTELEIELRSGEKIGCTPNHQWPTNRGLLRADELVSGDMIQRAQLPANTHDDPAHVPPVIGWFVGQYIADGSMSQNTIQIAGHALNDHERYERLKHIAHAYDGTAATHCLKGNAATCNITSPILTGILKRYVAGRTAYGKHLSLAVWQRSNRFLEHVIQGYLEADGHHENGRYRIGFTGRNDDLAADLRVAASRLGAALTLKRSTADAFGKTWPIWRGEWRWRPSEHHNAKDRAEIVAIGKSRARYFYDIGVEDEPHLFALASGLLTHNSKPSGLPESVRDRVRRSHEQWFHFTKEPDYVSAIDEIRVPQKHPATRKGGASHHNYHVGDTGQRKTNYADHIWNPLGKVPGSVWTIPSEPLIVPDEARERYGLPDHFAAFPQEWPRRLISGFSCVGWCQECGGPRLPIVETRLKVTGTATGKKKQATNTRTERKSQGGWDESGYTLGRQSVEILGYGCDCDTPAAPTTPAIVLDPFCGTGTTVGVARALGRKGIGVDLSRDYLRLAQWRIDKSGHFAKTRARTNADRQGRLL